MKDEPGYRLAMLVIAGIVLVFALGMAAIVGAEREKTKQLEILRQLQEEQGGEE